MKLRNSMICGLSCKVPVVERPVEDHGKIIQTIWGSQIYKRLICDPLNIRRYCLSEKY
ncbi:MAG: hypothetical protein KAR64_08140 [Thermoplasmatales archaeon]|nr:hypothetical protein [Thermoplasmatales archaeon]